VRFSPRPTWSRQSRRRHREGALKRLASSLGTLPAYAVFLALTAWHPQASGQSVISAMAGYIHHVEGDVFLGDRAIHPQPSDFLHVLDGQRLRTAEGRAEVMLTPGGFLRLGANSEIEMVSAGLAHARLRLTQGSAIVDLLSVFEKDSIAVLAGDCEVHFPKPGLYRLDAGDPIPALSVFRGKAIVLTGSGERKLKGKQVLALTDTGAAIEKFDAKATDALDEWSQTRATVLARAARNPKKGEADGMDPLYREWLEMTMRRPSQVPVSSGPRNQAPQSGNGPSQKRQ
jgi:hypothetical protein